jgi:hypothetical protein
MIDQVIWHVDPHHNEDPVVVIDVAKFDALWEFGRAEVEPRRVARIGEWVAAGRELGMPMVHVEGGKVLFSNGRHRFTWCRDDGMKTMPVTIPPRLEAELRRLVGAPGCMWP